MERDQTLTDAPNLEIRAVTSGQKFRGDVIRNSLEQLAFLGQGMKEVIIEDLNISGIALDDNTLYPMDDIEARLFHLFGPDASGLLVRKLKIGIRE